MKVEPLEKDVFMVSSEGTSGEGIEQYRVDLSKEDFGCSCKDWHYRRQRFYEAGHKDYVCKHIRASLLYTQNPLHNFYWNDK